MKILSLIIFLFSFNSQAFSFWLFDDPMSDLTEKQVSEKIKSLKLKIKEKTEVHNDLKNIRHIKKNQSMINAKAYFADFAYGVELNRHKTDTILLAGAAVLMFSSVGQAYEDTKRIKNRFLRWSSYYGLSVAGAFFLLLIANSAEAYGESVVRDFEALYEKYKKFNQSFTEEKKLEMLKEARDPQKLKHLFSQQKLMLKEIKKFDSFMNVLEKSLDRDKSKLEKLEKHQASFSEL